MAVFKFLLKKCVYNSYYTLHHELMNGRQLRLRGLVPSHCGKINVIMTLSFYRPRLPPPPPSLPLNVIAFHNTKTLILLHLAYTFSIPLYSTVLPMSSYQCFLDSFLLACSYMYTISYMLDTAVTKMQILTLLEAYLDLFSHKNAYRT